MLKLELMLNGISFRWNKSKMEVHLLIVLPSAPILAIPC